MAALEEIRNGAVVQGIIPVQPVEVVSVEWIGQQAINLVYRVQGGGVAETTLYRDSGSMPLAGPGPSMLMGICCGW